MLISVGIIFLSVVIYSAVHSVLASLAFKQFIRQLFGPGVDQFYRLAYNAFAVLSLLPVLAFVSLLPDRRLYTIPFPWSLAAFAVQAIAGVALLVGFWQTGVLSFLGLEQIAGAATAGNSRMLIKGLYRWVRHPLYSAGLVFIWLIPMMTVNILTFNVGLTAYILIGAVIEETKLVHEYGEQYRAYQKSTPMLVPWKAPVTTPGFLEKTDRGD